VKWAKWKEGIGTKGNKERNKFANLAKSSTAEELEDFILIGHRVKNFVLHQLVISVTLRIRASAAIAVITDLLRVGRHCVILMRLLLLLRLLLQRQLLLLLLMLLAVVLGGQVRRARSRGCGYIVARVSGMDCQALTITLS
jgi:hypothetical protein